MSIVVFTLTCKYFKTLLTSLGIVLCIKFACAIALFDINISFYCMDTCADGI